MRFSAAVSTGGAEAAPETADAQRAHQRLRHLAGVLVAHVVAHAAVAHRVQVGP